MNLLLLRAHEVAPSGIAFLPAADRRCRHLRTVLQVEVGQPLRAGVLDGAAGTATVIDVAEAGVTLACALAAVPPPGRDVLILAIPRPRVLLRCVETAAALGFARILLMRTWRTDRSHVEASALAADLLQAHAILGLEQAQRTALPAIEVFPLFKPFVEDDLDARCGDATRIVADPDADMGLVDLEALPDRPIALAVGPERGFTDYECTLLGEHGFVPHHAGRHPLRVETALTVAYAQLDLLRR